MTEEKKDVYEIKKESVKQFLLIVGGSFIGCLLAILLAGQLVKPKFPPCPCVKMVPPAPYAQLHKFPPRHQGEHHFKKIDKKQLPPFVKVKEGNQKPDFKTPTPLPQPQQ